MKKSKPRTQGQRAFNRDFRGTPAAPVRRTPAELPPQNAGELAQERIEALKFTTGWRERRTRGDFRGV